MVVVISFETEGKNHQPAAAAASAPSKFKISRPKIVECANRRLLIANLGRQAGLLARRSPKPDQQQPMEEAAKLEATIVSAFRDQNFNFSFIYFIDPHYRLYLTTTTTLAFEKVLAAVLAAAS